MRISWSSRPTARFLHSQATAPAPSWMSRELTKALILLSSCWIQPQVKKSSHAKQMATPFHRWRFLLTGNCWPPDTAYSAPCLRTAPDVPLRRQRAAIPFVCGTLKQVNHWQVSSIPAESSRLRSPRTPGCWLPAPMTARSTSGTRRSQKTSQSPSGPGTDGPRKTGSSIAVESSEAE
jgi:hypothetical protein